MEGAGRPKRRKEQNPFAVKRAAGAFQKNEFHGSRYAMCHGIHCWNLEMIAGTVVPRWSKTS